MRTEEEIRTAIKEIYENRELTYSYREDVVNILDWVLGGYEFDGLKKYEENEKNSN